MGRDGGGGGEGGEAERRDKEMVHIRFFPFSNGVLKLLVQIKADM